MDGEHDDGKSGEMVVIKEFGTKSALPSCLTNAWQSEPLGQVFY